MLKNNTNFGLPKWPALVVQGDRVSSEQAMEILVRTNSWHYTSNDHDWDRTIFRVAGIKYSEQQTNWLQVDWDDLRRFQDEMHILPINFLANQQISSSYVGGPHGWCDWNGRIETCTYNIGKWPAAHEVLEEWSTIAKAFPYLNLWCQLYDGEQCEDNISPAVEYVVREGRATMQSPTERTLRAKDDISVDTAESLFRPGRERGCSEAQLRKAFDLLRKR